MKKIILFIVVFLFGATLYAQNYPSSYTDGKYIEVNGAKLYVVLVGHGDPLIIIPGGPGGSHIGYRVFDSLAKDNEIIYFDAFASVHQPEMWNREAIGHTIGFLKPGGVFVTYAITGDLKRMIKEMGCRIEKAPGAPGKREMLRATKMNDTGPTKA